MHKSSIDVKLTTAAVSAEKRSAIHYILQLLLFLTFEVDRHSKFLNIKQTKTLSAIKWLFWEYSFTISDSSNITSISYFIKTTFSITFWHCRVTLLQGIYRSFSPMKKNYVIISASVIAKHVLTAKNTKILDQCAACVQPFNNNDSRTTRLILFWGV